MHRIAPILFIGGLLLLMTSLRVPASPSMVSAPTALAFLDAQSSAVLTAVSEEAARLRARRTEPPRVPVAARDPFSFGTDPTPDPAGAPVLTPLLEPPPPPLPPLPRLVAIASADDAGEPVRRAFVALDGMVIEVKAGDAIGRFVVHAVGATAIQLRDPVRATTHTLVLR